MFDLIPFNRRERRIFRSLDRDFDNFFRGLADVGMKTDIEDKGEYYELSAEMPGINKEDIKLSLNGDLLTISAEQKNERSSEDENCNFICRERSYSSYRRNFNVRDIKTEDIKAKYENGVLSLTLPKKDPKQVEAGPRQIAIE